MDIHGENHQLNEGQRFMVFLSLIGFCCFLTFYSSIVLNTTSVYSHFFYIPIFLASVWWKRKGVAVVFFLSFLLLGAYKLLSDAGITSCDYIRIGVFIFVGLFLAFSIEAKNPILPFNVTVFEIKKNILLKERARIAFIFVLIILSCSLTIYFHVVENRGTVFSHFFYIPIILSAIWWRRRGLWVAFFLASFLIFGHFFLRDYVITINDYFRAVMFIVVPFFVSFLGEKITKAERRIRFLDLVVGLVHNVNRLVMEEIDRKKLAEGIASAIIESSGCCKVVISLFNEKGDPEESITINSGIKSFRSEFAGDELKICQEKALKRSRYIISQCDDCGECKSHKRLACFSYRLEYDGLVYGVISAVFFETVLRDAELVSLLKNISDEFAYALCNLEVEKKKRRAEEELQNNDLRVTTILELSRMAGATLKDMSSFALDEAVKITGSEIGYLAFVDEENSFVEIKALVDSSGDEKSLVSGSNFFKLYEAGKISDVIASRRPLITEYSEQLREIENIYRMDKLKLKRHMDVPIFDSDRVVAVAGIGNRDSFYRDSDVKHVTLLMQGMWLILQQRRAEEELELYRENLKDMVRKRTEELEEANEKLKIEIGEKNSLCKNLEVSSRELENFVNTVTHDLKSPLFSMGLCAGMLERTYGELLDEKGIEYIQLIRKSTERMEELIKDVLTLSRIGMDHESAEEINILKLLVDITARLGYLFEDNSIEFVVKNSQQERLPVIIANKSQVIQVFENLLINAVKFMGDEEEPCVTVGFDSIENNFCRFYVQDNGIGIAEKDREKIFAEFYRTHDVDVDGTGIGLAIVKKIVEKYGGDIFVESEPQKGSTFYFSFPVKQSSLG